MPGKIKTKQLQDIGTNTLLGRDTAASGPIEQIGLGGDLEFDGAGNIRGAAYTGDVTKAAGGTALTIAASAVDETELNNVDGGVDADSFVLSSGWAAAAGTVAIGDTIEVALEKVVGNQVAASDPAIFSTPITVVADSNITLSGAGASIDGVTLVAGDIVAAIGQTTALDRRVYEVAAGAWIDVTEMAVGDSVAGMIFAVSGEGTEYGGSLFVVDNAIGLDVVGTDILVFTRIDAQLDGSSVVRDVTTGLIETGAITGDVAVAQGGTSATIQPDSVTFDKMQDITTDTLLGRDTAATGTVEEIGVGGGVEFDGAGNLQTSAFTGDVTKSAGGTAQTIAADAVTYAKIQNVVADDVLLGNIAGAGGIVAEITPTQIRTLINVEDGAAADQTAAEVVFTPNGTIAATDVQAAIVEVRDESLLLTGGTMSGAIAMGGSLITGLAPGVSSTDAATVGQITALQFVEPVASQSYLGTATVAETNALSPVAGDSVVLEDAGTPSAGTSDAGVAGSLMEFDGTSWLELVAGSGGFTPAGIRVHASTISTFVTGGGLTAATDEGDFFEFDGAALLPATQIARADGDVFLVNDGTNDNTLWSAQGLAGASASTVQISNVTDLVTSVFGRAGIVSAAASDYDASQVDNDSTVTGAFVDDALNSLQTDIDAIEDNGIASTNGSIAFTGTIGADTLVGETAFSTAGAANRSVAADVLASAAGGSTGGLLVGYDDPNSDFTAATVSAAITEVGTDLETVLTDIGGQDPANLDQTTLTPGSGNNLNTGATITGTPADGYIDAVTINGVGVPVNYNATGSNPGVYFRNSIDTVTRTGGDVVSGDLIFFNSDATWGTASPGLEADDCISAFFNTQTLFTH